MLTTSEAAALLGIRSKNTIKAMARRGLIAATLVGTRFLIPVTEVAWLQNAPVVHELRAVECDYDVMAFPGSNDPVGEEEMGSLRAGETGTLPWRRGPHCATRATTRCEQRRCWRERTTTSLITPATFRRLITVGPRVTGASRTLRRVHSFRGWRAARYRFSHSMSDSLRWSTEIAVCRQQLIC